MYRGTWNLESFSILSLSANRVFVSCDPSKGGGGVTVPNYRPKSLIYCHTFIYKPFLKISTQGFGSQTDPHSIPPSNTAEVNLDCLVFCSNFGSTLGRRILPEFDKQLRKLLDFS